MVGFQKIFIILAIVAKIHSEVQAATEPETEESADEPEQSEGESEQADEAEESDEELANKLQGNVVRYRELIGDFIGLDEIVGRIKSKKIVGPICIKWARLSSQVGLLLFRVRRMVATKKRLVDDAATK